MCDTLVLDSIVCAFQTKKTELINLGVIKEEKVHFAAQGEFHGGQGGRGGAGVYKISQTSNRGYTVQNYPHAL